MFEYTLTKRFAAACLVLLIALPCVAAQAEDEPPPSASPPIEAEAPAPSEPPAPVETETPPAETATPALTEPPAPIETATPPPEDGELSSDETPVPDGSPMPDESPEPTESPVPVDELEEIENAAQTVETPAVHPFWTTPFEEYTVSEGLLLLTFALLAVLALIKLFGR